jgi:hypothetical protein
LISVVETLYYLDEIDGRISVEDIRVGRWWQTRWNEGEGRTEETMRQAMDLARKWVLRLRWAVMSRERKYACLLARTRRSILSSADSQPAKN